MARAMPAHRHNARFGPTTAVPRLSRFANLHRECRAILIRWHKYACSDLPLITLACAPLWYLRLWPLSFWDGL